MRTIRDHTYECISKDTKDTKTGTEIETGIGLRLRLRLRGERARESERAYRDACRAASCGVVCTHTKG